MVVSGQVPEEPVVSTKSGLVYEKRLIEKAIATTGREPTTNEPLAETDLIAIKRMNREVRAISVSDHLVPNQPVKPRPVQATSIPGMLAMFQSEWDALMLETFTLKQHLDTVLTHVKAVY